MAETIRECYPKVKVLNASIKQLGTWLKATSYDHAYFQEEGVLKLDSNDTAAIKDRQIKFQDGNSQTDLQTRISTD